MTPPPHQCAAKFCPVQWWQDQTCLLQIPSKYRPFCICTAWFYSSSYMCIMGSTLNICVLKKYVMCYFCSIGRFKSHSRLKECHLYTVPHYVMHFQLVLLQLANKCHSSCPPPWPVHPCFLQNERLMQKWICNFICQWHGLKIGRFSQWWVCRPY